MDFYYGDYVFLREDANFENCAEQAELERLRDERAIGCVSRIIQTGEGGKVLGGIPVNFYTPFGSGDILTFTPSELVLHRKGHDD